MTNPITINSTKTVTSIIRNGTAIEKMMLAWEWQPQGFFLGDVQGAWYDPVNTANDDWRRNLLTFSEQFDNLAWGQRQRVSIAANVAVAPDGSMTADKLISTTVSGEKIFGLTTSTGLVGQTMSVYAKAAEISSFTIFNFLNGGSRGATFDLLGGTVTSNIGGVVGSIELLPDADGWYRCIARYDGFWTEGTNIRLPTGTGNDVDGIFIWGAQLDAGPIATPYQRITDVNTEVRALFSNTPMFQDSIGSAPNAAASASQTIGLWLDKSKMGIGANGSARKNLLAWSEGFDNTTTWSVGSGTTRIANQSANPINGEITADLFDASAGGTAYIRQATTQITGTSYVFSVYTKRITGRWFFLRNLYVVGGGPPSADASWFDLQDGVTGVKGTGITSTSIQDVGGGWFRCSVRTIGGVGNNLVDIGMSATNGVQDATGAEQCYIWGAQLEIGTTASDYQKITSDWLVSIPGNHALQTSTSLRPLFGRSPVSRRNLVLRTEEFGNAVWVKTNLNISDNKVIPTTTSGVHSITQDVLDVTDRVFTIEAKADGYDLLSLGIVNSTGPQVTVNLSTGAIVRSSGVGLVGAPSVTLLSDGYYRISLAVSQASRYDYSLAVTQPGGDGNPTVVWAGNGTSGILVRKPQLEAGSVATTYQKVVTALDVTEAGKPSYAFMRPDLSDDKLTTNMASTKNLIRYSEEFDNAVWLTASNFSASGGAVTRGALFTDRPDGTTGTVSTLAFPAVASNNYLFLYQSQFLGSLIGMPITYSVWLRVLSGTNTIYLGVEDVGQGPTASNSFGSPALTVTTTWQRFTLTGTRTSGVGNALAAIGFDTRVSAGQTSAVPLVVQAWGAQVELGSTATTYEYSGFRGDVIIAGKNGTAYETNVVSPTGLMDLGPLTCTGGTPEILRAVGDVVGYVMARKKLSDVEKDQAIRYYKKRGAKGILTPGPELVVNGDGGSTSDWLIFNNAGASSLTSVSNQFVFTSDATVAYAYQVLTTVPDKYYKIDFEIISRTATVYFRVSTFAGGNNLYNISNANINGLQTVIIKATTTTTFIHFGMIAGQSLTFDNISVKELRPEEEW